MTGIGIVESLLRTPSSGCHAARRSAPLSLYAGRGVGVRVLALELLTLELGGVALVEEAVFDLDPVGQVFAVDVLLHGLEGNRPEERARFHGGAESPVDDGVHGRILAVDRDHNDVFTRLASGL